VAAGTLAADRYMSVRSGAAALLPSMA
jgi:hypothetical protein